jgi:hypothetical protein
MKNKSPLTKDKGNLSLMTAGMSCISGKTISSTAILCLSVVKADAQLALTRPENIKGKTKLIFLFISFNLPFRKQKKSLIGTKKSCCFLGDSFNRLCRRHLPLVHAPTLKIKFWIKKKGQVLRECRGTHKTMQQSGPFSLSFYSEENKNKKL